MNKIKQIISRMLVLAIIYSCLSMYSTELKATNTFTLFHQSASVAPGANVCIDVTTKNFTAIAALQYDIVYPTDLLQFNSIINLNPALTNLLYNESPLGNVKVTWLDGNTTGVDLPDGTVLYQMCFTAVGSTGSMTDVYYNANSIVEVISGVTVDFVPWVIVDGNIKVGNLSLIHI